MNVNSNFDFNWFDFLLIVMIALGVWRGRKRGMSEELLDVLMWLCIVVGGALFYKPLGKTIASVTGINLLGSYIAAYATVGVLLKFLFASIKKAVGEKLVQSDTFGGFEYYLGMLAGALRFICILFFSINFLHARFISDAERAAVAKMQADNFGSISFPTIGSLQQGVFYESLSGPFVRKHLKAQLIEPVSSRSKPGETIGRRRERAVEEVLR
jgi:uncharacterized membrane protein required for colicin V production